MTVTVEKGCIEVDAHVYLEGALVDKQVPGVFGTVMRTDLYNNSLLPGQCYADPIFGTTVYTPAGQPYSIAPWNYNGTEGSLFDSGGNPANGKAGYAPTVVDWVLVSLRDRLDAAGVTLCRAAALLHNDGRIEFVGSGLSCCDLDMGANYYVVVEHRNHLIIMSSEALPVVNGKITCDFRVTQSYIDDSLFPGLFSGQKPVPGNRFAMIAGNGDQVSGPRSDTDINTDDRTWWELQNGSSGLYRSGDYNLTGDCNVNDRVLWEQNNGKFTSVPR